MSKLHSSYVQTTTTATGLSDVQTIPQYLLVYQVQLLPHYWLPSDVQTTIVATGISDVQTTTTVYQVFQTTGLLLCQMFKLLPQ